MKKHLKGIFTKVAIALMSIAIVGLCGFGLEGTHTLYGKAREVKEIPIARYEDPDDPWRATLTGTRYLEYKNDSGSSYMSYDCWEDGSCQVEMGIAGTEWNVTFVRNLYSPTAFRYTR